MEQNNKMISEKLICFLINFYATTKKPTDSYHNIKLNSHTFNILFILKYNLNNRITMTKLSDILNITKQQLTKLVNDLEEKEMVERMHDTANRRLVYIHITQKGIAVVEDSIKQIVDKFIPEIELFTEEEKTELFYCINQFDYFLKKLHFK